MQMSLGRIISAIAFAAILGATLFTSSAAASTGTLTITANTTLTSDHVGNIVIVADNVTLNCARHLVSGDGGGVGIDVLANGVSVANCRVQAFDTGIQTTSDATHILTNDVAHNGEGIRLSGATNATVSRNTASQNEFWGIIAAEGTSGAAITTNSANHNGLIGIALNTATGNHVSDNSATQNGDTGLDSLLSSGNQILNNAAMHNGNTGFGFESASGNTVIGNSATNNGTPGNGCGFCFNDSSNNSVSQNQAFRNGGVGFFAFFGSQFNVFSRNHGCRNFFVDALDISTGAGNAWIDNRFCTTSGI
jgi:parallel beta-helix repeat protein